MGGSSTRRPAVVLVLPLPAMLRQRALGPYPDAAGADGAARARGPLPGGVELAPGHRDHGAQRALVADLGREQPGDHDGGDERPRRREEPEAPPRPAFDTQDDEKRRDADEPRHVAG